MTTTVGDLKKLLETYPDDLPVVFLDNDGYFSDIDSLGCEILGLFQNSVNERLYPPYYRRYKLYENETWIEDREVLVLG